jgi:hypothetical protein
MNGFNRSASSYTYDQLIFMKERYWILPCIGISVILEATVALESPFHQFTELLTENFVIKKVMYPKTRSRSFPVVTAALALPKRVLVLLGWLVIREDNQR